MQFIQWPHVNNIKINSILDKEKFLLENRPILEEVFQFVNDINNNAVGIAANQVNHTDSWFIARDILSNKSILIINPAIIGKLDNKSYTEGCFSLSGKHYRVRRAKTITALFYYCDETLKEFSLFKDTLSGRAAQIFQHEIDHLKGNCIADIGKEI